MAFAVNRACLHILESESRGKGLVMRYWGCNLRCPLCFAQSYAYQNRDSRRIKKYILIEELSHQVKQDLLSVDQKDLRWIRIEGGEPLASATHCDFMVKIIETLGRELDVRKKLVIVIQTNGVHLGQRLENAKSFYESIIKLLQSMSNRRELKIAIEISFKGSNEKACNAYSGVPGIHRIQCNAFMYSLEILENYWAKGIEQIAVYPVAGFGPSFEDLVLIPLDPDALERGATMPLFHKDTWSEEFANVVNAFRHVVRSYDGVYRDYARSHGEKIHMYGLEVRARKWQMAWISRAYRDVDLKNFVGKHLRLNRNALRYAGFYKKHLQALDLINADDEILSRVDEMREYFVELKPAQHYPYL